MSYPFPNPNSPPPSTHKNHKQGKPKKISVDLQSVLANPDDFPIKASENKIYLGQAAAYPNSKERTPFWLPTALFDSHLFIGGAIGSGKTTVLFRLISGALRWYGTVIISEAKGGVRGTKEGAAFTDLAAYLQEKDTKISVCRWPRGEYYFNPLENLLNSSERREFFEMLCQVIISQYEGMSGDLLAVIYNAAAIAEYLLVLLQNFYPPDALTLRSLVNLLSMPKQVEEALKNGKNKINLDLNSQNLTPEKKEELQEKTNLLEKIEQQLRLANFFYMDHKELVMTRRGVQIFQDLLDQEDLLTYTEPHPNLKKLSFDDILYHKTLVILSQPLSQSSSKIIGPIFLDNFLNYVLELGSNPKTKNGKDRLKTLVILDETHRLPVGKIGDSGDYLREYGIGLVEVAPTIPKDNKRWEQNKHVYQTLLSLSPGIPTLTELMRDRLPHIPPSPMVVRNYQDRQGNIFPQPERRENYDLVLGQDNPGITSRSMQLSGRFTGLLQSSFIDENRRLFWIDFEDELLANIKTLLKKALAPDATPQDKNLVDYALGLDKYRPL